MNPDPPNSKPNPDPTIATNEAVERGMKSERDYVDGEIKVLMERMRGMDTATELLSETARKMPEHVKTAVECATDLMNERFAKVANQFSERDTRSERESRDNKVAVDAAFAAQKEAAAKQEDTFKESINKSEGTTTETIKTNQQLSTSRIDALTKSLDEVKLQVGRIEAVKQGGKEAVGSVYVLAGLVIGSVSIAVAIIIK